MEHAAWLRDIYKLEPVHDGEEEHVLDDQSRLRQDTSTHGGEPTSEVIDLGSPSCSSDIENGNVLPFDNDTGTVAHTTEDQFDNRVRSSTRDSVIADSVELVEYAQLGPFEPDGAFPTHTPVNHGDGPESASIATVRRWRWEDLVEHLDRKRVVSKVRAELVHFANLLAYATWHMLIQILHCCLLVACLHTSQSAPRLDPIRPSQPFACCHDSRVWRQLEQCTGPGAGVLAWVEMRDQHIWRRGELHLD